jgi:hypothetical protein
MISAVIGEIEEAEAETEADLKTDWAELQKSEGERKQ